MRYIFAAILICIAASVELGFAQDAANEEKATALLVRNPLLNQNQANAPTVSAEKPSPASTPENIADDTKDALAREWLDPKAVEHVLNALRLYTTLTPKNGKGAGFLDPREAAKEALEELIAVDRRYEDLYRAAQGGPDALGQPNAQGQAEFLDMLAKANTLKKEKKDEPQLFEDTRKLIDVIFNTSPSGKQDLVKIKDSFVRGDNHVALFQLLDAYPKPPEDKVKEYADNLETLRAAYKMDAKALADLVAAKIAPEKE